MMMDFVIFGTIVMLVLIFIYRYYTVNARCEEVGQVLTWHTFWNKPELYEMITSPNRGTSSERQLVSRLLASGFKPTAIYHDLLVNSGNSKTAQIDIVVATDAGLIVIEVKDFSGWIFGKGNQDYWTQVSGYGKYKSASITHSNRMRDTSRLSAGYLHRWPYYPCIRWLCLQGIVN